ncbi:hypothetical protein PV392_25305 [Streptomyces sp. ME03-5709C]|nr:hypothetical protein [Streptomyces sp. ME03-5709C]
MDELIRPRVYGADVDDPDPGPKPGREYRELVGGPLDGLLFDVTGVTEPQHCAGVELRTDIGRFGPGGRARYAPRPGDGARWDWRGDSR